MLFVTLGHAQGAKEISIRFIPEFHQKPVTFGETYYRLSDKDSINFETLKCYISVIVFYKDNKPVFKENNSYHLLNAEEGKMMMSIKAPVGLIYDAISFNLGVDSVTNTSGILTGDLDPLKGMYWTWQSGYINFKLEGRSNLCPARNNSFNFHLGGYLSHDNAIQTVRLKVKNTSTIPIILPLDKFIALIDLSKQNSVMIPGKEAVRLSQLIAGLFEVRE
jgi:hypothetical protein